MGFLVRTALTLLVVAGDASASSYNIHGWYYDSPAIWAACNAYIAGTADSEVCLFGNPAGDIECGAGVNYVYSWDSMTGHNAWCWTPTCPVDKPPDPVTGECVETGAQCELTDLDCGLGAHVDDPGSAQCKCVYDECSIEQGTRMDGNPSGYPAGSGMCIGGCLFLQGMQMQGPFSDVGAPGTEVAVWKPTGSQCNSGPVDAAAQPPVAPEQDVTDATECVWDDNGNSYCTDGNAPENCGYFNDEYICVAQTDNCTRYESGSATCSGSKEPVSGPNGTRESPTPVPAPVWTGTTSQAFGSSTSGAGGYPGEGSGFNYWNAGQGVIIGWGDGLPSDPDNPGTVDDSPDPDLPVANPEELVQEHDEPEGGFDGAFDFGIPATASCPADTQVQIFGSYSFSIEWDLACELMETIRPFVIASAAATSLYLLVTMGR